MDPICVAYRDARAALQAKGDEYLARDRDRAELLALVRALPPAEECSDRECEFALRAISASRLEDFRNVPMPDGRSVRGFAIDALTDADRKVTGPARRDAVGMKQPIQDLLL